jgi:hypothetical protein
VPPAPDRRTWYASGRTYDAAMPRRPPLVPNPERLRDAYALIEGIPDGQVTLEAWCDEDGDLETTVRTVACIPVWLVRHPDFQVAGFQLAQSNQDAATYVARTKDLAETFESDASDEYVRQLLGYGWRDLNDLFGPRGASRFDVHDSLTDKQAWQHRVRKFLRAVPERN